MEQHQQQTQQIQTTQQQGQPVQQNMILYNFNPADGILTPAANPVQVEFGSTDIARQINQQVQLQYANMQSGIPAEQTQQIVITHQPTYDTTENIDPSFIKTPKAKQRSVGERISCPSCGKSFSCNANLRDHMRLHTGEKPFQCTECNMCFAQRSNWRLHKRVHTGERPYMCGICGKTFSRSSHLPGHIRVHTGERPFQCSACDHTFASSQALKNHSRTHTGERPFVCAICKTAFTHSSSLSSHKKRCNGVKQKRGRPTGSSWKKKKSSSRSRGRPRKRGRLTRQGKGVSESSDADIKQEVNESDIQEGDEASDLAYTAAEDVLLQENGIGDHVVQIDVEALNNAVEGDQEIGTTVDEGEFKYNAEAEDPKRVHLTADMVRAAATAAGLTDSSDLHQEAAVTMTTLQHGVVNLAHQTDELE